MNFITWYKRHKIICWSSAIVFIVLFWAFIYKDIAPGASLRAYSDEPKIYYKLAAAKTQGIFYNAGLLGFCEDTLSGRLRQKNSVSNYISGVCQNYYPYYSQSGLQGFIYSVIDKFYSNPIIFRMLCAFFLAAVLTAWFVWLCRYLNLIPSLIIISSTLLFNSIVFYGDNIAQVLGVNYLIMVVMFWAYKKKYKYIGAVAFFAVLIKLLISGPEYLFSAVLLPFIPLVFYAILDKKLFREVILEAFLIARGTVLSCLLAFLILFTQVSIVYSLVGAFNFFITKAVFRMSLPINTSLTNLVYPTNSVTLWELLYKYLSLPCISINHLNISFGVMILFFGIISTLALYLYRRNKQRLLLAFLITTWTSILCPLAWILIAKGHSATEFHDNLVWHMPFTLMGMALTVVTLKSLFNKRPV